MLNPGNGLGSNSGTTGRGNKGSGISKHGRSVAGIHVAGNQRGNTMTNKKRFHVATLPHTKTTKEYLPCAYTQKVLNFCKMMKSLGHDVYHYGAEGSEADCTEHITTITA